MASIRRNLAEYLLRVNYFEKEAERLRKAIADNRYFQAETVFQRFDKFTKGYLIPDDFSEFMLDNKVYPSDSELYLIFRDFDPERTGVVTITRFEQEVLPKEDQKAFDNAKSRKHYSTGVRLELDLEYLLARLFELKVRQCNELAKLRLEMHTVESKSVDLAFELLDVNSKGSITKLEEIDRFLRNNGKVIPSGDLARIFRALSFGRERPIVFETFWEHFDPLSRGYYVNYSQRNLEKIDMQRSYLESRYEQSRLIKSEAQRIIEERQRQSREVEAYYQGELERSMQGSIRRNW